MLRAWQKTLSRRNALLRVRIYLAMRLQPATAMCFCAKDTLRCLLPKSVTPKRMTKGSSEYDGVAWPHLHSDTAHRTGCTE